MAEGSTNDVWIRAAASDQTIVKYMEGQDVNVHFIGSEEEIRLLLQSVVESKTPMGRTVFFVNALSL